MLANEYDAVQIGMLLSKRLKHTDAVLFIQEGRGKRYDPAVVDAFMSVMASTVHAVREQALHPDQLRTGMVLSRDLLSGQGDLLLSKDHQLDASLIEQIKSYGQLGDELVIYISDK